jgi:hypothetical protein
MAGKSDNFSCKAAAINKIEELHDGSAGSGIGSIGGTAQQAAG